MEIRAEGEGEGEEDGIARDMDESTGGEGRGTINRWDEY